MKMFPVFQIRETNQIQVNRIQETISRQGTLVQVINFATEKTWQYPRISVDIATSKCFFCRGNFFVAIATTPNLPWIQ